MRKVFAVMVCAVMLLAPGSLAWAAKLFDCPIKDVPAVVSCAYGDAGYKGHTGYDLQAGYGTPIYALFDGKVTYRVIYSDRKNDGKYHSWSYGNVLELTSDELIDGKRYSMLVAHLSEFDGKTYTVPKEIDGIELVCDHDTTADRGSYTGVPKKWICKEGMSVKKGQLIGYSGSCGNSTGNHLHIEIRENSKLVDPNGYISLERFVGELKSVNIDERNFPDENFRTHVSGFDADGDGILSSNELEVAYVILVNGRVKDLKGIEHFTALTFLDCANNQLTALDLSKNTALTTLYCENNQLTALDLSKNTALTQLFCGDNQLTALDLSKNTALTTLYCDNNQLTALDLSKNTALTLLYCANNQLTALDLSKNTALQHLYCENNQLTALDLSKNTALQYLDCSNNQLTALDLSKNTALTGLYCKDNQLTELDLSECLRLREIHCDDDVKIIPEAETKPKIIMYPLTDAKTGSYYSFKLEAKSSAVISSVMERAKWTYTGRLPEGITLSEAGIISGTPAKAGSYTFTVTATNSIGSTTAKFTLHVFDPVSITTASLKAGNIGKNYSVTMKAKGSKTITWSAEGLPDGLTINAKGKISGKPSSHGKFTVKITARNRAGSVTKNLTLEIKADAPKLSGTIKKASLNESYLSSLKLTAGSEPVTWSISGTLPRGLKFDTETGIIYGTPTSYERSGYKLVITAKNSAGEKSKKVTLMIKGTAPRITTAKLPEATVNKSYSFTLSATGSGPIIFTAENLPEGLTLSGGVISGKPTEAAKSFRIVIYAENPVKTVRKSFMLKINDEEGDTRLPVAVYSNENMKAALTDEVFAGTIAGEYIFPLGEISCDVSGMYDFALELPDYIPEDSELVYAANSESPSDDDDIAEFFDDTGEEITAVPESRKITVSIWLNEGVIYKPVVIVKK